MNVIRCANEAEWLAARANLLTASDVAAVIGANKYCSPDQIFIEKTTGVRRAMTPAQVKKMEYGQLLQPFIVGRYGIETGRKVRECDQHTILLHPDLPWFGCTLDAEYSDDGEEWFPLEVKNSEFGSAWKDGAPEMYAVQLAAQVAIVGARKGAIAAFIGGCRLAPFEHPRDLDFEADMLAKCSAFMSEVQAFREVEKEIA